MLEHQGRSTDLPETVSDLVKGFAVLSRLHASTMPPEHAITLLEIVQSLLARAERCGWEESADLLQGVDTALNRRVAPPR